MTESKAHMLRLIEQEVDRQAAKLWGLTESDLVQVSSSR